MKKPIIRLTLSHRVIANKLLQRDGRATAQELNSNYAAIEPMIRAGFVTVVNDNGTPVYTLTESGTIWGRGFDLVEE
jgi:predicted transcriptional regulator with HTH domain